MKGVLSPNRPIEADASRTLGQKGDRVKTIHYSVLRWLFVFVVLVFAGGCVGSTVIQPDHPLIAREGATETAKVYFIRPDPGSFYGVMNMPVSISLAGKALLKLAKGEYTLVQLAAGTTELKADSYTVIGSNMAKVSSNTQLSFSAGETHYLVFEMVPREVKVFPPEPFPPGFVFLPRQVSRDRALDAVQGLTPVGAAVAKPIAR